MATKKATANAKPSRPSVKDLRRQIADLERNRQELIVKLDAAERQRDMHKSLRDQAEQSFANLKARVGEMQVFLGSGKLLDSAAFGAQHEAVTLIRAAQALGHRVIARVVEETSEKSPNLMRIELIAHENLLPPTIGVR